VCNLLFLASIKRRLFGKHVMTRHDIAMLIHRQIGNDFEKFDALFQQVANELLNDELLERRHIHDGILDPSDFTPETGDLLAEEIWGQGFPQPIFYGEFEVAQQSLMKDKHLRLQLRPSGVTMSGNTVFTGVWFNRTQPLPAKAKLAYRLVTDRYQGQARVQLMIEAHDEG